MMRERIFGALHLEPGEVSKRSGKSFEIKQIKVKKYNSKVIPRVLTYLIAIK